MQLLLSGGEEEGERERERERQVKGRDECKELKKYRRIEGEYRGDGSCPHKKFDNYFYTVSHWLLSESCVPVGSYSQVIKDSNLVVLMKEFTEFYQQYY